MATNKTTSSIILLPSTFLLSPLLPHVMVLYSFWAFYLISVTYLNITGLMKSRELWVKMEQWVTKIQVSILRGVQHWCIALKSCVSKGHTMSQADYWESKTNCLRKKFTLFIKKVDCISESFPLGITIKTLYQWQIRDYIMTGPCLTKAWPLSWWWGCICPQISA